MKLIDLTGHLLTEGWRQPKQNLSASAQSAPAQQPTKGELEQTCTEFASIFFHTLLKSMYSTIPTSSSCPEFEGKKVVNFLVDQKMAQFMASSHGHGLKELLLAKLTADNNESLK